MSDLRKVLGMTAMVQTLTDIVVMQHALDSFPGSVRRLELPGWTEQELTDLFGKLRMLADMAEDCIANAMYNTVKLAFDDCVEAAKSPPK